MRSSFALLIVLLLISVTCMQEAEVEDPVIIVVTQEDNLPEYLYDELPKVRLDQPISADALLISSDLLQEAHKDAQLQKRLEEIANSIPLVIYNATTTEVDDALPGLGLSTSTTESSRYLATAVRVYNSPRKVVVTGGVLTPLDNTRSEQDFLLESIKKQIHLIEQQNPEQ